MMKIETPFGAAWAAIDEAGALTAFGFGEPRAADCEGRNPEVARQLREFFSGGRDAFDLPLGARGSEFQKAVWRELIRIPFGETISYAELAARIGRPGAARAVGRANATNPIALIVPCHRVIGSDGTLTGYAFGTELKRQLLEWERQVSERVRALLPAAAEDRQPVAGDPRPLPRERRTAQRGA